MSTKPLPTLILPGARLALAACEAHALSIGIPMNIAIVDSTLHLLSFTRMENAKLTSIDIAINKAFTAAGHRVPTSTYKEAVWPGGAAFSIWNSNDGRFCTIAGGVPIVDAEGRVVGAVGCSTGTPAQDEEVARKGVEVVERKLREEAGRVKAKL